MLPWQKAAQAAETAREIWGLPRGPIGNRDLSELLEVDESFINPASVPEGGELSVGFRNGSKQELQAYLKSPRPASRRFALMRMIGDHAGVASDDRILPADLQTHTSRQKFQRAFSQEFLCPYTTLCDYLEIEPFIKQEIADDSIEAAATHFGVSPLLIRSTLVNKGNLIRDKLRL
jgi:hypothetical protein